LVCFVDSVGFVEFFGFIEFVGFVGFFGFIEFIWFEGSDVRNQRSEIDDPADF